MGIQLFLLCFTGSDKRIRVKPQAVSCQWDAVRQIVLTTVWIGRSGVFGIFLQVYQ